MWVLQEYRFYLIIAVIALAGIIFLFFRTQTSQGYVDFTTEIKSNFAQIKGQASETKSLYDVVTIDGQNFRGMRNNQLFGMTLDASNVPTTSTEALIAEDISDLTTFDLPSSGQFKVVFLDPTVDGIVTASGATMATNPADKGWNLEANGEIVYVFDEDTTARKVMVDYIPEGTLVDVGGESNNAVAVPFIQR